MGDPLYRIHRPKMNSGESSGDFGYDTKKIILFRSSDKRTELPDDLRHSIQSWNNADFELFDRVNKTFWSRVINFGLDRMEKEKKILNDQIDIWLDYCVANISTITQNDLRQKWKKKIKSDPRMLNTTIQDSFKDFKINSQRLNVTYDGQFSVKK